MLCLCCAVLPLDHRQSATIGKLGPCQGGGHKEPSQAKPSRFTTPSLSIKTTGHVVSELFEVRM